MKTMLFAACALVLAGAMTLATVEPTQAHNHRGAFVAGLIIGGVAGAISANQVRRYHGRQYYTYGGHRYAFGRGQVWNQHVQYCYGRYRSYNHRTNLFLAYSGNYRHCRSPWIR
ncbi:MAG: BA14K family protein [Devosiaceae bacterium]|nr:BA14K family protein [Devosiaceae bacterium MH13]